MTKLNLALLAAAAIGAVTIGSASAMPFQAMPAAPGESRVQDVRVVCDQYQRCYDTRRGNRRTQPYAYAPPYNAYNGYNNYDGYYASPGYGYYGGPRVGIGIGPFGVGVW